MPRFVFWQGFVNPTYDFLYLARFKNPADTVSIKFTLTQITCALSAIIFFTCTLHYSEQRLQRFIVLLVFIIKLLVSLEASVGPGVRSVHCLFDIFSTR